MDLKEFVKQLSEEERRSLLLYAVSKGCTSRDLNLSPSYLYLLKKGQRRITDTVMEKILKYLTVYDFFEWARSSVWLERRPDAAEVRGSNPRGPTTLLDLSCYILSYY